MNPTHPRAIGSSLRGMKPKTLRMISGGLFLVAAAAFVIGGNAVTAAAFFVLGAGSLVIGARSP